MAKKKAEEIEDFEDFEDFEEDPIFTDFDAGEETDQPKEETKAEMQARIKALESEIKENKKILKEGPKMARKGGIYLVTRATTYKGKTLQAGQKKYLEDPNVTNKWLKKIGEFEIDKGFQEDLNGKIKDHVEEDGVVKEAYRE